ncbi:hypothetical protein [Prauserella flavalba]|uniref:hypothetical protein n=1 Tax=Prauserella flavalba TaxID=1477506 RepID=UPI001FE44564|nr:hypothetical protein [Prauserella flavalba]
MAIFVVPVLSGVDFGNQVDFVFGFYEANGVAAGLTLRLLPGGDRGQREVVPTPLR